MINEGHRIEGGSDSNESGVIVENNRSAISGALTDIVKSKSLAEELKQNYPEIADVSSLSVPGFEGQEVIQIKVKNKEQWAKEEELRKLSKAFNEVAFHAYKDREDKTLFNEDDPVLMEKLFQENIVGADLSVSDTIIATAKEGKITGFISFSGLELEDGLYADKLMLTAVRPDQEGKTNLGKKLYEIAFQNLKSDYLIGASHTPSTIKNRISVGEQAGWQTYYCGYRNGNSDIKMTDHEANVVETAERGLKQDCINDPDLSPFQTADIPPHYVSYGDIGIPPRRLEELKFKPNEAPLDKTMRELVTWQQSNHKDHTIYGILVSVRKSKLEEGDKVL